MSRPLALAGLPMRLHEAWLRRWWRWQGRRALHRQGVQGADAVHCLGLPLVRRSAGSTIDLGRDVVLCSDSRFTDLGVSRPVILRTLRPGAAIRIGPDTGLSGTAVCAAVSVQIGTGCLFGADVQVTDTDFHALAAAGRRHESRHERIASAPVVIEDNVFLGAGVRVLKGVRIGRDSVIGAGSVVTRDIPAGVIAAGNPARVLKPLPDTTPWNEPAAG